MNRFGDLKNARNRAAEPAALPSPVARPGPERPTAVGRGGKRDDPAYSQATVYLRSDVLHNVKRRLLDEKGPGGKGRDLSTLVGELLAAWVERPAV